MNGTTVIDDFFSDTNEPSYLNDRKSKVNEFIDYHKARNTKIVLVTSGGTSVPLERKMVRYIDNFSMGTRGSASSEYFLAQGYAVVFLHRTFTLQPYHRHFSSSNILDMVELSNTPESADAKLKAEFQASLKEHLSTYETVCRERLLLSLTFTTLHEYLHMLRLCSQCLGRYGNHAMLYLAAAVSDFYIPTKDITEHKIQSSNGSLSLNLNIVPKMLKPLVNHWCPRAFVVSFKLETDDDILMDKSLMSLDNYKHQVVVANILETRKERVVLVTHEIQHKIQLTPNELAGGMEIETSIVQELTNLHLAFVNQDLSRVN